MVALAGETRGPERGGAMAEGYTIKHVDDFEDMEGSGNATWHLARKSLGGESFGFNVVDIALGGQGTIVSDGAEQDAPAGTYARYAPEVKRTIRNHSEANVRALLIGVPVDSGYQG